MMEQKCGKCANSGKVLASHGRDATGAYYQEYEDCRSCVPVAKDPPTMLDFEYHKALAAYVAAKESTNAAYNAARNATDAVRVAYSNAILAEESAHRAFRAYRTLRDDARLALEAIAPPAADDASKTGRCYGNGR